MKMPEWCRECPFYYSGMTIEDYLYLQYCIREKNLSETVLRIQRGDVALSPVEDRTKEEVFGILSGNLDYIFDSELMC